LLAGFLLALFLLAVASNAVAEQTETFTTLAIVGVQSCTDGSEHASLGCDRVGSGGTTRRQQQEEVCETPPTTAYDAFQCDIRQGAYNGSAMHQTHHYKAYCPSAAAQGLDYPYVLKN